jgi:hypothetical protein
MGVRRLLASASAAPLLLVALTACGGGDASIADPPVAPSTSTSPTDPPRQESPEHFIRRWAEAEQEMQNSGQTGQYLAMSRGCQACEVLAHTVARYYRAGGFIRWGGWDIRSIKKYPPHGNGAAFSVHSVSAPTTYRVSSDGPIQHLSGGSITYVIRLEPHSGSFHVAAKAQLDQ